MPYQRQLYRVTLNALWELVVTKDSVDNKLLQKSIALSLDGVRLHGELCIPKKASNIVMFVHGSGSSRFSSRNRYVAEELNKHNQATLLFDLLSTEEESVEHHAMRRFDIRFLARRVAEVSKWLSDSAETRNLKLAYFGASTGAAAALVAAAALPEQVHAVVSRGGRPDLAGSALSDVQAPDATDRWELRH